MGHCVRLCEVGLDLLKDVGCIELDGTHVMMLPEMEMQSANKTYYSKENIIKHHLESLKFKNALKCSSWQQILLS